MRSRLISYILICLLLYVGFTYSGYRLFLIALIVLLLLGIASLAQLLWIRNRLTLTQKLEPDPVFTLDAAYLIIEITSKTRLPIPVLEIITEQRLVDPFVVTEKSKSATKNDKPFASGFVSKIRSKNDKSLVSGLTASAETKNDKPSQLIFRNRRLTSCIGRGTYIENIRLRTSITRTYEVYAGKINIQDPFGLFRLKVCCAVPGGSESLNLHVLPRPNEKLLVNSWLQSNREGINPTQRLSDEINTVADLHQMYPGDSPKRIHWIVSAKQNQWMIKMFEKDEQAQVLLLLDLGQTSLPDRLITARREAVLGLGSAAVQQMLLTELSVLLVTSDSELRYTYAVRPDQQLDLLVHLASAPEQSGSGLRHQAQEALTRLNIEAMVVVVTATPDPELNALCADLSRAGHRVVVIYYENPIFKPQRAANELLKLSNTGAHLIRIKETDPAKTRLPEKLHKVRKSADGWRQLRREVSQ